MSDPSNTFTGAGVRKTSFGDRVAVTTTGASLTVSLACVESWVVWAATSTGPDTRAAISRSGSGRNSRGMGNLSRALSGEAIPEEHQDDADEFGDVEDFGVTESRERAADARQQRAQSDQGIADEASTRLTP